MTDNTNTEPAVRCSGITKHYGEGEAQVQALRGIDLDVKTGELLMLVGPSGCGKTTLISIIVGILDPDEGSCLLFGRDMKQFTKAELTSYRGSNIGFVFQSFNLIPALTAAENVAIPLLINGMKMAPALLEARKRLNEVSLEHREDALPSQLSGGQQQRVAIARALVHNPTLVVCDEPTSALDGETGHKVMEVLKKLAVGSERSLVIVTHDSRIYEFADRIAHIEDGRIVSVDTEK